MKIKLFALITLLLSAELAATNGYYRFPDLNQQSLVFTAEGDLWLHQLGNKDAKRLTTHAAEEREARFSPDGSQVAFVANYHGQTEVYVISTSGGLAKRVTFENNSVKLQGWSKDNRILYSTSNRIGPTGNRTLRLVNPNNLVTETIPLADAVEGSLDKPNKFIYFTQFGLQISTDNAKVYRGGAMGQIWKYQLNSKKEAMQLTKDHLGSARQPMVGDKHLYFISDASGSDNIWRMDFNGKNKTQVTKYSKWPVRAARLDKNKIVYQLAADIKMLDLASSNSKKLAIELTSDLPNLREKWLNNPMRFTTSIRQAGDFEKVVITARGRVAVATNNKSRLVEIATKPDSRTRKAILSHNGKWVYAINDASGESEIWKFPSDGSQGAKQLTKNGSVFRWNIVLSPDGKWIAHDDANGDLWLLNTVNGSNKKIVEDNYALSAYSDVKWSKNSKLLAVTRNHKNQERSRILLYSLKDKKQLLLTTDKYNSYSPAFSHDDQWLYFLSDRNFNPTPRSPWGDRNMGVMFDRRTQIYAYALNSNAEFPFKAITELTVKKKKSKNKKGEDKKDSGKKKSKNNKSKKLVDWKGIKNRLWQVPVAAGNYSRLSVNKEFLYVRDFVNEPNSKNTIQAIKIEPSPKAKKFTDNVNGFTLSDDGKKMFVAKGGNDNKNLFIVSAGASFPKDTKKAKIQTASWQLMIQPQLEWKQILHDAWIMHRDQFFDKKMRNVNWAKVEKQYSGLLDRVTDRYELNDLLGQMTGELNALHSQVRGGDMPSQKNRPRAASLGANLTQSSQGTVIERIFQYDPELPSQASPLAKPEVNAKEGDIILAINGIETKSIVDVNRQLINQAGKQVLLKLKRGKKTIKTVVVPASSRQDSRIRYNEWVHQNRAKVEKANDEVGYLHIYAMGSGDISPVCSRFLCKLP